MKIPFAITLIYFGVLFPIHGMAQIVSITGYIKNASTGEVKKNVAVLESGSGIGTITNSEGYFRLLLNPGLKKLEVSSQGFQTYTSTFNLSADTLISIELVPYEFTEGKSISVKETNYGVFPNYNSKDTLISRHQ